MGLSPSEFWGMHLWEYNLRVKVYNTMQAEGAKIDFYRAHTAAALTAQGFAGKLRQASHYINDKAVEEQSELLSDEQIAEIDRALKEKDKNGG